MAVRLSKDFGGSAETWLTQQAHYDLAQVRADRIKLKRLERNANAGRRVPQGARGAVPEWGLCAAPPWNFNIDPPPAMLYDDTSESPRGESRVKFEIELDREEDGRWIAEISSLPGVLAYGKSKQEAIAKVKALALRVLADEVEKEKQDRPLDISIACCP
jgi:predicted RNase H-like HicB family nuclease